MRLTETDWIVGNDELYDTEHALLQALATGLDALSALLADDFVITTAVWIAEPADKPTCGSLAWAR